MPKKMPALMAFNAETNPVIEPRRVLRICRGCVCWLVALVAVGGPAAQELRAQPTLPNASLIRDVAGRSFSGVLTSLNGEKLNVEREGQRTWSTPDLLRIDFVGRPAVRLQSGSAVYLANGDRLKVRPMAANAESLGADWGDFPLLQSIDIPLATIAAIAFQIPESRSERARLERALRNGAASSDVLMLANGDRAGGEFAGIDERSVALEVSVGEMRVERSGIHALLFNAELTSFPQPATPLVLVTLIDGSRLTGRNIRCDKRILRFDALFGEPLKFPLSVVSSVQFLNGRGIYLSDLEPLEYRFTPFLSYNWKLTRDVGVDGGPLLLRGAEVLQTTATPGDDTDSRITVRVAIGQVATLIRADVFARELRALRR